MSSKGQFTGMRGVYLVAAELSHLGLIASPTSRSAIGADILATDQKCQRAYSIQVKTNATTFNFWLLNKEAKKIKSPSYFYVFVNLRPKGEIEYYIVPSFVVAIKIKVEKSKKGSIWYSFSLQDAKKYKDKWNLFENPK
ncbi:MAG: hypothetical protein QMD94_02945 [Candidatus Omnitrophota bacterium]|nr:hypothetical protein [Candidatus Omnitrophota bacterium]